MRSLAPLVCLSLLITAAPAVAGQRQQPPRPSPRPQAPHPSPGPQNPRQSPQPEPQPFTFEVRSLDGSGNNAAHPAWGTVGTPYKRYAPAAYGDRVGAIAAGPSPRNVSNRVFNDLGQNIFSERGVTQWVWTWGQFMDHTFGLAKDSAESAPMAFDAGDPLEDFHNDLSTLSFKRDAAAPGTGTSPSNPRQQVNTVSSYIDGWSVYGGTQSRQEWLREGPFDGSLANNSAKLMLSGDGYLPSASARGDAASAPTMAAEGALRSHPQDAAVAGDVRANENIALTATHTLFAREHNRIVASLPASLSDEQRFQIARRVIGAEQQFITYEEFLPALGVRMDPYRGYRPGVDATLGNEFATVAYRAHSMIHGEFEFDVAADRYSAAQLSAMQAKGVEVEAGNSAAEIKLVVSLNAAFFDPELLRMIGVGPVLQGLGAERQYNNDEQMDNALRSVLFGVPGQFQGVVDLGALDVNRARDHGIPNYNGLRRAFGLRPARSFTDITGERTDRFPPGLGIDSRASLDYVDLRDKNGTQVQPGTDAAAEDVVRATRRTTLAARLRAIYGSVEKVDAFTGLVAERHVPGTEFGELQLRVWGQQFQALRDGDRFFYRGDRVLDELQRRYGITYRHRLSELIRMDSDAPAGEVPADVFTVAR